MSEAFGQLALRLAGLSARALGWRPVDFWTATPAELAAALAPFEDASQTPVGRDELKRMMENDHAGPG